LPGLREQQHLEQGEHQRLYDPQATRFQDLAQLQHPTSHPGAINHIQLQHPLQHTSSNTHLTNHPMSNPNIANEHAGSHYSGGNPSQYPPIAYWQQAHPLADGANSERCHQRVYESSQLILMSSNRIHTPQNSNLAWGGIFVRFGSISPRYFLNFSQIRIRKVLITLVRAAKNIPTALPNRDEPTVPIRPKVLLPESF
jgi:hypothetical protein